MLHCPATRAAVFLLTVALPIAGFAQDSETLLLDGHKVTLTPTEDFTFALSVDGTKLFEMEQVLLDGTVSVAGQEVLTGVAGPGGNACSAAPFVLSLKDGKPRLDGPADTCSWLERSVEGDALIFGTHPLPGLESEVWRWTAASGLVAAQGENFTPDSSKGWDDFASLADQHPIDALGFAPVFAQLKAGLSAADWEEYTAILSELGSGGLQPSGYRGTACIKLVCEDAWAYLWIDPASQQAVAAWKPEGAATPKSFPPDAAAWPEWIKTDAEEEVFAGE